MQSDSCSMTPPSSPLMQAGGQADQMPFAQSNISPDHDFGASEGLILNCLSHTSLLTVNKEVFAKRISRFIDLSGNISSTYRINLTTDSAIFKNRFNYGDVFHSIRQYILNLQRNDGVPKNSDDLIKIHATLQRLMVVVQFYLDDRKAHPSEPLTTDVKVFCDKLAVQTSNIWVFLMEMYHTKSMSVLHALLDIQTFTLQVFAAIINIRPDIDAMRGAVSLSEDRDVMEQMIEAFLWQHMYFAMTAINNKPTSFKMSSSPLHCCCVQLFVMQLNHLCHQRHLSTGKRHFLALLSSIFEDRLKQHKEKRRMISRLQRKHSIKFDVDTVFTGVADMDCYMTYLWFLVHMSPALSYHDPAIFTNSEQVRQQVADYYKMVVYLTKCTSDACNHKQIEEYLFMITEGSCYIVKSIPPTYDYVVHVWDLLCKHSDLNKTGEDKLWTSTKKLHQRAVDIANNTSTTSEGSNFLRFLVILCQYLKNDLDGLAWKRIKGRIMSKFHAKRLGELSEVALQNVILLFLSVGVVVDTEGMLTKMVELLFSSNEANKVINKKLIIWRGCFAACLMGLKKDLSLQPITEKLGGSINSIVQKLGSQPNDVAIAKLWPLVEAYLEGCQDVVEYSNRLDRGQNYLLVASLRSLLISGHNAKPVLDFAQTVLTSVRVLSKSGSSDKSIGTTQFSDALWHIFYNFICDQCTGTGLPTAPKVPIPTSLLADIAASFCLLCLSSPPSEQSECNATLVTCFACFGWGEKVQARVRCRFLNHLLGNSEIVRSMAGCLVNFSVHLGKSWVYCSLWLPLNDPEVMRLSNFVSPMLSEHQIRVSDLVSYVKAIAQTYSNFRGGYENIIEKVKYREEVTQIFDGLSKYIPDLLKETEIVGQLYDVLCQMMYHGYQIFYSKSKPTCALCEVFDALFSPRMAQQRAADHKQQTPKDVLARNIPMVIRTLALLDYQRDAYISRKLSEILRSGLELFSSDSHPFLSVLLEPLSPNATPQQSSQFRQDILSLLCSEYLRSAAGAHTASLWQLLLNYVTTAEEPIVAVDSVVLVKNCLEYVLCNDSSAFKQISLKVVVKVLEACVRNQPLMPREPMEETLRNFVLEYFAKHHGKVLSVLRASVASVYPELLTPIIPDLLSSVQQSESTRGVGTDTPLRMALNNLLRELKEDSQ